MNNITIPLSFDQIEEKIKSIFQKIIDDNWIYMKIQVLDCCLIVPKVQCVLQYKDATISVLLNKNSLNENYIIKNLSQAVNDLFIARSNHERKF